MEPKDSAVIIEQLQYLKEGLKELKEDINAVLETLGRQHGIQERHTALLDAQHQTLQEHQRRSLALEDTQEIMRGETVEFRNYMAAWSGVAKFLAVIGGLAGIASVVLRLLGK